MSVERNNLITPAGYKKLIDALKALEEERPKIVEEVSFAAKQGDRSENAEYIYGKKRLREIDSKTRFISGKLERSRVIKPCEQTGPLVLFGASVVLEDEKGKLHNFQIIGEDEIDVSHGKISWKSPVGAALMKHKVEDYVEVETPNGVVSYKIVSIEYK